MSAMPKAPQGRSWAVSIEEELQSRYLASGKNAGQDETECTIFRAPQKLRRANPEQFEHELVSLGLFYPNHPGTRGEECKVEMASAFLEAAHLKPSNWQSICERVVVDPASAKACYYELDNQPAAEFSAEEIRALLTLDAVFLGCYLGVRSSGFPDGAFPSLSRCTNQLDVDTIDRDILLMENQIPLSLVRNALVILYESEGYSDPPWATENLLRWVGDYARDLYEIPTGLESDTDVSMDAYAHILDYAHTSICRETPGADTRGSRDKGKSVRSVSQLQRAGIVFRGHRGRISDVRFRRGILGAVLEIPEFEFIGDGSEELWRNMLAYESMAKEGQEFTCFITFMDELIDTPEDVMLLRKGKHPVILGNGLGDDKAVARQFNSVLKNVGLAVDHPKWLALQSNINAFYDEKYRKNSVEFVSTYFGKPWVFISVIAATMLLLMTFVQALYAVLTYYPRIKFFN